MHKPMLTLKWRRRCLQPLTVFRKLGYIKPLYTLHVLFVYLDGEKHDVISYRRRNAIMKSMFVVDKIRNEYVCGSLKVTRYTGDREATL